MLRFIKKSISQGSSVFLNLIRLVACELVVIGHFLTRYQPATAEASLRLGRTLGGTAVLLFFALSGLLISYSLRNKLDNPEYRFRNYFVDRFSRIYSGLLPAMLFGTIIVVIIYVTNYSYFMQLCSMQSTPSLFTFGMTLGMLERFPVNFFNSLLSVFGLSFPFPDVTPYGFNGILWVLVIEWWLYMVFGWIVIGSLGLIRKQKSGKSYQIIFLAVAALLSLLLIAMYQQNSSFIIVWFVGVLMMLAISSKTLNTKLSSNPRPTLLVILFILSLASAVYEMYVTFAWTDQYYGLNLGILLSACVFLGVLLLNEGGFKRVSKLILNKNIVSWITIGAGYSYTLYLTHYPIIIFLNGLNLTGNRFLMMLPILLITNLTAFALAHFTEKKHKELARTIKKWLHMSQC
jgi:peptidoglycan/LPS O-acetylase OafA/YrhL